MVLSNNLAAPEKAAYNLLVIEDNPEYAQNAKEAFQGHNVFLAANLEEAISFLQKHKIDFILSDVYFPTSASEEPKEQVSAILNIAFESNLPLALITNSDENGLSKPPGEEAHYVAIRAFSVPELRKSQENLASWAKKEEDWGFSSFDLTIPTKYPEATYAKAKTPKMWVQAFRLLRQMPIAAKPPIPKPIPPMQSAERPHKILRS